MFTHLKDYGEVLRPLYIAALPDYIAQIYATSSLFREWLHLHDKVIRAEKVSSWTQWTDEQRAAYERVDTVCFSRLRGYSEQEIQDFVRYMSLCREVDIEQGDDDFCLAAMHAIMLLVGSDNLDRLEAQLQEMSEAALEKIDN